MSPRDRMPACASAMVVFVSAGPGAPDLITLRGARELARADVVLCDALADPGFREMAPQARWIDVGKRGYGRSTPQAVIHAQMIEYALAGRRVVRLKGGDAGIFGRLEEELLALDAAGIACEIVPGVTAALAAAAQLHRPLTRRGLGRTVSLSTAVTADDEGMQRPVDARSADSEVFYMAGRRLATLSRRLLAAGWAADTPVSVVSRAGCRDALASDHSLGDLAAAAVLHGGRPAVVTVGIAARPVVVPRQRWQEDLAALQPPA